MKPLVEYYQERENHIQQELKKTRKPSEIVEIVEQETDKLIDTNGEYIGQLTSLQEDIAIKGLADIVKILKFLTLVKIKESNPKPEKIKKSKPHFNKSIFPQIITGSLIGIISAALALFLIYKNIEPQDLETTVQYPTPESQLSLIILAGVVVGATLSTASYYLLKNQEVSEDSVKFEPPELEVDEPELEVDEPELEVDEPELEVDEFVLQFLPLYLKDQFELIDSAVASKAPLPSPPSPPSPEIEDHKILLEFLQGLLADSIYKREQLTDFTLHKINKLVIILRKKYGIKAKYYEHSDEPNALIEAQDLFSFKSGINKNRKEYMAVTPALLRGNRVILPGCVLRPYSSEEE